MKQSLVDIINTEEADFVQEVLQCDSVEILMKKLDKADTINRQAIIQARIQNINHLVI